MPTSQNNSTDKRQLLSSDQPKSLWRNRDYLLLWSGQALSDIGGAVSELAFPLLVLAVTHSPAQAGFVAALRVLPAPLFSRSFPFPTLSLAKVSLFVSLTGRHELKFPRYILSGENRRKSVGTSNYNPFASIAHTC